MAKIFVAGISFGFKTFILDHYAKTKSVIDKLQEIHSFAVNLMGEEVIVIITLQEYAFTPKAIPNIQKKECLDKLEKALKQHKNIILIPGSFAAYDKLSECANPEGRKHKIIDNYNKNLKNPEYTQDLSYVRDYLNTKEKFSDETVSQSICLQNSAYILNSEGNSKRIKHKKSYPWKEEKRLSNVTDHFFYMGADSEVKTVTINNQQIDIGLIICREHLISPSDEITQNPPPIEVIVSATISTEEKNLFGALNIHMDAVHGLSVSMNDKHPKCHTIGEVKSFYYDLDQGNVVEKPIVHFSETIGVTPAKALSDQPCGFKSGFLTNKNIYGGFKKGFFNPPIHTTSNKNLSTTTKITKEKEEFGGLKKGFLR